MREILAVSLYISKHVLVAGMLVLIVHGITLSVLKKATVYKMLSYFLFCGLWIVYVYRLGSHGGLQKYWIYTSILGTVVIAFICTLLNRSHKNV